MSTFLVREFTVGAKISRAASTCGAVRHEVELPSLHSVFRVEMAARGNFEKSVFCSIHGVACIQHGLMDHFVFLGRNIGLLVLVHGLRNPDPGGVKIDHADSRKRRRQSRHSRSGNVAPRPALLASARAAGPIRILRRIAVIPLDDRLGLDRHLVFRTPGVIHDFLGMPQREAGAADVARMSGIGRCRGIAAPHPASAP